MRQTKYLILRQRFSDGCFVDLEKDANELLRKGWQIIAVTHPGGPNLLMHLVKYNGEE